MKVIPVTAIVAQLKTTFLGIKNKQFIVVLFLFSAATAMNFCDREGFMFWLRYSSLLFLLIQLWRIQLYAAALASMFMGALYYALLFPRLANHSNLELFITVLIFGLLAYRFLYRKNLLPTAILPWIFRISTISIYWYAGFHKLNTDFFDLNSSCVITLNDLVFAANAYFGILSKITLVKVLLVATVLIEMVVPFGLLFRKTRKIAAVFILTFHAYLSIRQIADFSALAVFLLSGSFFDFSTSTNTKRLIKSVRFYGLFVALAILSDFVLYALKIAPGIVIIIHGLIYNIGVLLLFRGIFRTPFREQAALTKSQKFKLLLIPALITVWTIRPYLGLGNAANFTMFSNLVTEKSRSNHLLINTNYTKLTNWEEDYVTLIKLPESWKEEQFEGFLLPKMEFAYQIKRQSSRFPDEAMPATVIYKGKTIVVPDLRKSEFATIKFYYKFIFFRKIPIDGPCPCLW